MYGTVILIVRAKGHSFGRTFHSAFKVDNINTRTMYEILFKVNNKGNRTTSLTISSDVMSFSVNFEQISHIVLVFRLLTLNK